VPHRTLGVAVAQGGEPGLHRFGTQGDVVGAEVRGGVQQRSVEDPFMQAPYVPFDGVPFGEQGIGAGPGGAHGAGSGLGQGP
jgi:hypothetical protein